MAAQAKIQSANILLITLKALGTEITKNLVLAGVGSLTILDDGLITESDLGAQFFLPSDSGNDNREGKDGEAAAPPAVIGQNRAQVALPAVQKLNPRVQVHADVEGAKSKGPSYFGSFDVVIATDLDTDTFNLINTATRINGRKFYAASTHGMYGFIFSDLIEHDYVIERDVGNVTTQPKQESRTRAIIDVQTKKQGAKQVESVTKRELYSTWYLASDTAALPGEYATSKRRLRNVTPALSCLRALWEFMQAKGGRVPGNREDLKTFTQMATIKHKALGLPSETLSSEFLRSFLQNVGSEIAPVTAILGGQLAQDVINVLGQKEQPIQNMVIFDGTTMEALMYPLHPEGTLGILQLSLVGNDPLMGNGGADVTNGLMMGGAGMGDLAFDPTAMGGLPMPDGFPMPGMLPTQMSLDGTLPNQLSNGTADGTAAPTEPQQPVQPDISKETTTETITTTTQPKDAESANPPVSS